MHQATLDLQKAMQKMKKSYREYYILKMDVRKFFNSIDKKILYKILKKRIKDEKLLWLIRQILSAQERQKGIEIGNYTSQTFANIYLNELDQYATRKLKIKNYYRYMDDIVILARNKNEAKEYLNEIKEFLQKSIDMALEAGVKKEKIVLDPGIGFGKTYEQNIEVLNRLGELRDLGYPILLGTSRKSVLGKILEGSTPKERVNATVATTVLGVRDGVDIVRVHDVKENKEAAMVADAMYRK